MLLPVFVSRRVVDGCCWELKSCCCCVLAASEGPAPEVCTLPFDIGNRILQGQLSFLIRAGGGSERAGGGGEQESHREAKVWPIFSMMSDCETYLIQLGVTAGAEGVSLLSPS